MTDDTKKPRPLGRPVGTTGDKKEPHTLSFRTEWWANVVDRAKETGSPVNEYIEKHLKF